MDINENLWRDAFSLFCCDKDNDITDFIRNKAIEYEKRDKARTYIYFSIAMKTMIIPVIESMSNSLRKKLGNLSDKEQNLVVFLIGQLGRDTSYPSNCLEGKRMLQDCYGLIGECKRYSWWESYIVGM